MRGMSSYQDQVRQNTGLFSRAGSAVERSLPPEVRDIELLSRPLEIISDDYNLGDWQETPSKIIRHDGCYHMWIIDTPLGGRTRPAGSSTTRYLKSRDGVQWLDQGFVPAGPAGSHDDRDRLAPDVVRYDGRFYLFYESNTNNPQPWGGHSRCGIGCIVADDPGGPWRPATDDLLLRPSADAEAFDHAVVTNPRMEYLHGKWFMYYKARKFHVGETPAGYLTENGVAVSDHILGPYTKYEGNPLMTGHSAFLLKYRHGLIYFNTAPEQICWTEDGFTFVAVKDFGGEHDTGAFMRWSAFHVPNHPLYGGDPALPDATEVWGVSSMWRERFGYHQRNNDIIGVTCRLGRGSPD